ncbi:hypothetical protein [Ornithinimicrobium pekingense]|uniref:Uncharacterized protein n=1 Tax=Ornithinimicrobium pekingense TaxID=384677 RepID=A0ABQ2F313_9MICO|nr:hypothetical protein [Ornithinimicrobium pekingense]GGK57146.1 hypothetical protein GCM10011509_01910 [Ornithinimicrobium pekingense]
MTYEIALYPRRAGQDWADVVAADEQDGPPMDRTQLEAGVATFRRIEAHLRELLTEPVEVWVAEEADGDVLGELTATGSGLQVELYDRSASVSFPTGATEGRALLHDQARRAVRVVATETGYEAYDPQTGRAYDGLFDDGSQPGPPVGGTAAASTEPSVPSAAAAPAGPAGPPSPLADPRLDPRMLRRRAVLYLVLGAALMVFALARLSAGDTGWLTWLFLGFAGFNLLAGWMMRQLAAQATQRAAEEPGTAGA